MIDFIERLLAKWFKTTPKDTYQKLLEQFNSTDTLMSDLPQMLCEFWNRVDPSDFLDGPSYRDMMYVPLEVRHKTLGELERIMLLATSGIIHDDETAIMNISRNEFMAIQSGSMDDYFSGIQGGSIPYHKGVTIIKELMAKHSEAIENSTSKYYARVLNRMYNDILDITRLIITNMKET